MHLPSRYRSRCPRTPKYTTWGPPSRLSTIQIRQLARQVGASARSSGASVMASSSRVVFPQHVVNTEVPGGHIQFGSMSPTSVIDATLVFDSDNVSTTAPEVSSAQNELLSTTFQIRTASPQIRTPMTSTTIQAASQLASRSTTTPIVSPTRT